LYARCSRHPEHDRAVNIRSEVDRIIIIPRRKDDPRANLIGEIRTGKTGIAFLRTGSHQHGERTGIPDYGNLMLRNPGLGFV
jgi:hypothetical protein